MRNWSSFFWGTAWETCECSLKSSAWHIHSLFLIYHWPKFAPKEYWLIQYVCSGAAGDGGAALAGIPVSGGRDIQGRKHDCMYHLRQVAVRLHLVVAMFRTMGRHGTSDTLPKRTIKNSSFLSMAQEWVSQHITIQLEMQNCSERSLSEVAFGQNSVNSRTRGTQGCCLGI